MSRGRPSVAQGMIVSFMETKPDRVLDLKLDASKVQSLALERLGEEINLRKAVERLASSGRLHPLQAGRFAFTEEPTRTARLMDLDPVAEAVLRRLGIPYYLSWHSALWHHGLIDQQSRRVYAAVTRRKREARVGAGVVQFVFVSDKDKFFGGELVTHFEWPVRIARADKAIIDSLYRPRYASSVPVVADSLRRGFAEGLGRPSAARQRRAALRQPTHQPAPGLFHGPVRDSWLGRARAPNWQGVRNRARREATLREPGEAPREQTVAGLRRSGHSQNRRRT